MNLTFEPLIPVGLIALAGIVLALADLGPLWRVRALVATPRRVLISVFSLLAILVALTPLLSPRIRSEKTRKGSALVLVDSSRSMATEDAADGRSRFAAATKVAQDLTRSVTGAHWETRAFDAGVHDVPGSAQGARTSLGDAIAQARGAPEAPAAIVLITDGAQTAGADAVAAAREARAAGVPVFTVRVGSATRTPPARIASVEVNAPDRVALGARTTVHVSTELEGLGGSPVEVTLELDGKEVGRAPVEAASPRSRREAAFSVALDEAGLRRLVATVQSGERKASAARTIRVLASELRVALIDGPARWEHRYLRRALEETPRVKLTRVDVWTSEAERANEQAIAAVQSCDVIVLGDVARRILSADLGRAILRAVDEDGKGLLLLGGRNAFGCALDLGLAPLLPATVGDDVTPVARSFRPQETEAGRALLARALSVPENEVRETLLRMPALASFEPLGTPRAGSLVVLESPGRRPLLVLGRWGLGRTGMLATDETWRWAFTAARTGSERGGPREAHQALLHEMVTWLAARSAGLDAPLIVTPRRERIEAGSTLSADVTIGATSSAASSVLVRATLEDASGNIVARQEGPRGRDGRANLGLEVPLQAAGELILRATAHDAAGRELARDERIVTALAGEKEERIGEPADPGLLVRVADAGGGAAFAEEDVARGDARSVLGATLDPARQVVRETRPLAAGASQVLVLALFLSASWGLRRGAGLR